jgi:trans-2,3-dihydro-3-hydroxyanthranilate isomerase
MRVPFRLLDVFTEVPFAGNQLCVVPEVPAGLDGAAMLMLAREIAFSETTFVTAVRPDGYDVRIFTPEKELPFAGHPTLGTAYLLASEGRVGVDLVQRCGAGDVPVSVDLARGYGRMRQLTPTFGREVGDLGSVAAAAGLEPDDLVEGLPVIPGSSGIPHVLVPVRHEDALRRATRDDGRCRAVCEAAEHAESLYLFAVRGDGDVMARMFDRWPSIGEDPATGSAAGPLGAYLTRQGLAGMPGSVVVAQGELTGRPSFLHVDVEAVDGSWIVHVGGGVRVVGEGTFEL